MKSKKIQGEIDFELYKKCKLYLLEHDLNWTDLIKGALIEALEKETENEVR